MVNEEQVWQLYPLPGQEVELKGLYLGHALRQEGERLGRAFIYANFVTSLDGRIAVKHPSKPGLTVPKNVANDRDWRLFQELAVQADLIITTGRYLRDYVDGRAQEILTVHEDPRYADLQEWRSSQGLKPHPDFAVLSNSLDFPIPDALTKADRRVLIFTSGSADPMKLMQLEAQTGEVVVAGDEQVEGERLRKALTERGYQTVYSAAGPKVLHTLATENTLDRLYLTFTGRMLGGQTFATFVDGSAFEPPVDMQLNTLYFDPHGLDGVGQLFTSYNRKAQ